MCVAQLCSSIGRPHTCGPAPAQLHFTFLSWLLGTCPLAGRPCQPPPHTAQPRPTAAPSPPSACTTPATPNPQCIHGCSPPLKGGSSLPSLSKYQYLRMPGRLRALKYLVNMQTSTFSPFIYLFIFDAFLIAFQTLLESVFEEKPF